MHGNIAERRVDDKSPLGRLFQANRITQAEYLAGVRWREVYHSYLFAIESPDPFGGDADQLSDDQCERIEEAFDIGRQILEALGKRVFHAVSAIVVYEEPEELGDFAFTSSAAQRGLAALAERF